MSDSRDLKNLPDPLTLDELEEYRRHGIERRDDLRVKTQGALEKVRATAEDWDETTQSVTVHIAPPAATSSPKSDKLSASSWIVQIVREFAIIIQNLPPTWQGIVTTLLIGLVAYFFFLLTHLIASKSIEFDGNPKTNQHQHKPDVHERVHDFLSCRS